MFLLPLGLLGGADLSIADTIVKNFVPTTIGNAIAGAVVVAASPVRGSPDRRPFAPTDASAVT